MTSQDDDEEWVRRRVSRAVPTLEESDVAAISKTLRSQPNAAALRREAEGLLGKSKAVRFCCNDLIKRLYNEKRVGPLNCLRCGTVTAGPMDARGEVSPSVAYAEIEKRLLARRSEWPRCPFCHESLSQQLRHGEYEDESLERAVKLAARLVQYDRETSQRTKVIDDQRDWYETSDPASSSFDDNRRAKLVATIDFAGRKVYDVVVAEDDEEHREPTGVAAPPLAADDEMLYAR